MKTAPFIKAINQYNATLLSPAACPTCLGRRGRGVGELEGNKREEKQTQRLKLKVKSKQNQIKFQNFKLYTFNDNSSPSLAQG